MTSHYRSESLRITMSDADIGADEAALVNEVLASRALSCGPMIDRFEQEWAARLDVPFAVAVSSGTAGLHLAMIAAGVADDDLVITSPYSFVASSNAALYQRAVPIFVDVEPDTLNIDPVLVAEALDDLQRGGGAAARWLPRHGALAVRPAKAVLPVHVFGRPATMRAIMASARRHGAAVIEDACEAVGATIDGQQAGTFGDAGVFGFFPNKQLAMGEGGVITTTREDWATLFRSLRNQGRSISGAWLSYARLGYNYRLTDLSAAVGLAQLRRIDDLLAKRAHVAAAYRERLNVDGVTTIVPGEGPTASWFVYVVRFAPDIDRDAVIADLESKGIPSRPYFPSIHLQPFYRERFGFTEGDFPHAEAASRSTLALPFHATLSPAAIDIVADAVRDAVRRLRGTARSDRTVATAPRSPAAPVSRETASMSRAAQLPVDLIVDTFLPRAAARLRLDAVKSLVSRRRVLVTGAGGSIGSELCRQVASLGPERLVMLDRYENGLHAVAEELGSRPGVSAVIADITDTVRLGAVMRGARPDLVLHAAAHKHVPLMEQNPCEAVKNNVTGTRLVIEAARQAGAAHFVLISTDKAVRPSSVMGATKQLAERIVARESVSSDMRCVSVRFGNVLGSNGSVLHTFLAQVRAGGPVRVTHPDVRRYFMRIPEAAQLVLHAASGAPAGSLAVLDLGEPIPIVDLARHVIQTCGPRDGREVPIVFTGLRPGEKLDEELVGDDETLVPSAIPGVSWVASEAGDLDLLDEKVRRLEAVAEREDADATRTMLLELIGSGRQAVG